jgi:hypothetical protein
METREQLLKRIAELEADNERLRQESEKREEEQQERILRLQHALAEIKTLSGMIPICANCKKIRDDAGFWHQVEAYVRERSRADFSHGLCPECAAKLYPRPEK